MVPSDITLNCFSKQRPTKTKAPPVAPGGAFCIETIPVERPIPMPTILPFPSTPHTAHPVDLVELTVLLGDPQLASELLAPRQIGETNADYLARRQAAADISADLNGSELPRSAAYELGSVA